MAAWLDPALAGRLEAAGIVTLVQLVERIKAQRIVEWLRGHEATIGLAIGPAPEIRPLEKFVMPADLDGSQGLRRRPQAQSLLAASNDYQVILAWLRSKERAEPGAAGEARGAAPGPTDARGEAGLEQPFDWLQTLSNTQRAYRKEAERFLLWAIVDRGKALSSMANEDCIVYREFLADPQPASHWCGERARERWSPRWRPFEGSCCSRRSARRSRSLRTCTGFWWTRTTWWAIPGRRSGYRQTRAVGERQQELYRRTVGTSSRRS